MRVEIGHSWARWHPGADWKSALGHGNRKTKLLEPLVSILIINYNYGSYLAEAIDSALNQSYPHKEIIVVDDGSTDNSRDVIAAFGDRVVPICKDNGGQASAWNVGFARSKGDVICFLDSDDIFLPSKIERVLAAFASRPTGWCFHEQQWTDATLHPIDTPRISYKSGYYDFRAEVRQGKCRFYPPATSGLSFSRRLLEQVFPMPETITMAADNYLKHCSMAIEPGHFIAETLTLQRIHRDNAYTGKKNDPLRANTALAIATGLRNHFPLLREAANRFFAAAIVAKWRAGADLRTSSTLMRDYVTKLSWRERPELFARIAYEAARKAVLSK